MNIRKVFGTRSLHAMKKPRGSSASTYSIELCVAHPPQFCSAGFKTPGEAPPWRASPGCGWIFCPIWLASYLHIEPVGGPYKRCCRRWSRCRARISSQVSCLPLTVTKGIIELEARASSALSMYFCMPSRRIVRIAVLSVTTNEARSGCNVVKDL